MENRSSVTSEKLVLRFGLVAVGLLCWDGTNRVLNFGGISVPLLTALFALGLSATGFVLFFLAAQRQLHERATWAILAAALLIFASQWIAQIPLQDGVQNRIDEWMFSDYSARLLRTGHNPYQEDMLGSLWINRSPVDNSTTPEFDGSLVSRFVYPSLAFIIFVPFQMVGLSTQIVFPMFLALTLVALFLAAPSEWRPIAVLPLFIVSKFSAVSFNGVNDILWIFFLILMIWAWKHHRQRALWFGIACACKQQPWLLAPFLLIRLWHESRDASIRQRWYALLEFSIIAGGVFLAFNGPFIAWNAQAWWNGITDALSGNLILLGDGLSQLTFFNLVLIPQTAFFAFMLGIYLVLLYLYYRHFHDWTEFMWLAPGLALWFGHRSLSNYWYFFALPFFVALMRREQLEAAGSTATQTPHPTPGQGVRLRAKAILSMALIGGLVVLIGGSLIFFKLRAPDLTVEVQQPVQLGSNGVEHLQVKVANQSTATLTPRFSVQFSAGEPVFWHIDQGSPTLDPGRTENYVLSAINGDGTFDATTGAQVIVTDAKTDDLRAAAMIVPDRDASFYDPLPNGDFTYWNADLQSPYLWQVLAPNGVASPVQMAQEPGQSIAPILKFNLPAGVESANWTQVMLGTRIPFPHTAIQLWVKPPRMDQDGLQSAQPPAFHLAYGLELAPTGGSDRVWVLFGDQEGHGQMAPGLYYWTIKAPAESWSLQSVNVQQIMDELGLSLPPLLSPNRNGLPYPTRMLDVRLLLAGRNQNQTIGAEFGPIHSQDVFPNMESLTAEILAYPDELAVWHGQYVMARGNNDLAQDFFRQALDANSHDADAYQGFAETSLALQQWSAAVIAFQQALQNADMHLLSVYDGLGNAHFALGHYDQASYAFQQAIQTAQNAAPGDLFGNNDPHIQADAEIGLGLVLLKQHQCGVAQSFLQEGLRLAPGDSRAQASIQACAQEQVF
ncbi:MAG TPA: hypothetical protein VKQ72_00215 [Aggregatilineales bacterium]|nr:hypothetical protein [Aggregatilineales bacterium]